MPDWTREYFERGYAERWGLPAPSDHVRRQAAGLSTLLQHATQGVGAWTLDATGRLVGFLPIALGDMGGWRVNGK